MNAEFWQAAAEWVGIALTVAMFIGNFIFTANNYRMLANFVTKADHAKTEARVSDVEDEISEIKVKIGNLATKDDLGAIYNKLSGVETGVATMRGTLGGVADQLSANNHMLNLLVQNELKGVKQ